LKPTRGVDSPLVDIVISNHDYGAFVGDAIESALRQDHPLVHVVVVDDGSTDDSRRRLQGYADSVEVVLQENRGQAGALNAGLERCRGEVVIFLDADDVLQPGIAARVVAAFAANPRAARVQFRMEVIDSTGRPTGATKPAPHLPMPRGDLRRAEVSFPFDMAWLPTSGNAFRTAALHRILPIPEREYPRCGADWHLIHLTTLLGSVVSLEQAGASYRVHGGNSYEPQDQRLDLHHVRETIGFARSTTRALERLADELGLERPDPILSVADVANRLLSRKLEPHLHPVPGDSTWRLVVAGIRATGRRFDISWAMKAMLATWFVAAAVAPQPLTRRLGEWLVFPERRTAFNRLLARLHPSPGGAR
jgi:hypothetical protein